MSFWMTLFFMRCLIERVFCKKKKKKNWTALCRWCFKYNFNNIGCSSNKLKLNHTYSTQSNIQIIFAVCTFIKQPLELKNKGSTSV